MASAKSSRSRALAPSGLAPSGIQHLGGSIPGSHESGVQLSDKLKLFKTDNFDPDAYMQSKCQSMNEKVSSIPLSLLLLSVMVSLNCLNLIRRIARTLFGMIYCEYKMCEL